MVYSTYIGGSTRDEPYALAIDTKNEPVIAGLTDSTDYPTTSGCFQSKNKASIGRTGFVSKLTSGGSNLVYSTYLGGSKFDECYAVSLDSAGDAIVGGSTYSQDFPTVAGGFQTTFPSGMTASTAFLSELNVNGSSLNFSTFTGGNGDMVYATAVDSDGNIYAAGPAGSNFPATAGAFMPTYPEGGGSFVAKFNSTATTLLFGTFLGGNTLIGEIGNPTIVNAISLDGSGNPCLAGITSATDFPTTPGAFETSNTTDQAGFITQMKADGSGLLYSTFFTAFGTAQEGYASVAVVILGLKVNATGNFVFVGDDGTFGGNTMTNIPTTNGAYNTQSGFGFFSTLQPDSAAPAFVGFVAEPSPVYGGLTATGNITLSNSATSNTSAQISGPSTLAFPTSVTVPAGSAFAQFNVGTPGVAAPTTVQITAKVGSTVLTAPLKILPAVVNQIYVTADPPYPIGEISGGQQVLLGINLTGNAGPNGFRVQIKSSDPAAALPPTSFTIPANSNSGLAVIQTYGVDSNTNVTFTVSYGTTTLTTPLAVLAASIAGTSFEIPFVPGTGANGTALINLTAAAGPSGYPISLHSSSPNLVTQSSVNVPFKSSMIAVPLQLTPVQTATTVTLTETASSGTTTATVQLTPSFAFRLVESSVVGGRNNLATIILNGPVSSATKASLTTSSPFALVPASITIPAGAASYQFQFATKPVTFATSVTVTCSLGGFTGTQTFTIEPASPSGLTLNPNPVIGGAKSVGTIQLPAPAPAGGAVVTVTSNSGAALVPQSITVGPGKTSGPFTILTGSVTQPTTALITVSYQGTSATQTLTINP
jgi:hypothetical protein